VVREVQIPLQLADGLLSDQVTDAQNSASGQFEELEDCFALPIIGLAHTLILISQALQFVEIARNHLEKVKADSDLVASFGAKNGKHVIRRDRLMSLKLPDRESSGHAHFTLME